MCPDDVFFEKMTFDSCFILTLSRPSCLVRFQLSRTGHSNVSRLQEGRHKPAGSSDAAVQIENSELFDGLRDIELT